MEATIIVKVGVDEEADIILPAVASPSQQQQQQQRKRRRMTKGQRNTVTTHFSDRTHKVDTKVTSTFDKMLEEGKVKVGVYHNLPEDATLYGYFSLLFPEAMWTELVS